ncbi:ATP-binding protein [Pedobacter antarcticus]|uniref:ATP-binding protein n=1 Tax=Pedobacter antarcticus TaxID=34086 RepID=UPI00088A939E|nr:ATP-binding protein [Pedobacter antarcticus]SDL70386.1 Signal transduction histidine kinase [Pedobacter antarcticus]
MKIRSRLTMVFTLLFAVIFIGFAFFTYYSSAANREDEYYKRLRQLAVTKTNLLLDAKVAPGVLQLIYKNTPNNLFQEEVAIYDTSFNLLYHDAVDIDKIKETRAMINTIVTNGEIEFKQGQLQAVGFLYMYKGDQYVITAAAKDEYGLAKMANLRFILILATLGSITLTVFAGYFFAKQALKPVADMIDDVEELSASNLDLRLTIPNNGKDEIAELAITFNQMLDRLEHSFSSQKEFVSHLSHELRTPLATVIAELEIALNKERTADQYRESIVQALNDARRLTRLSTSLLDLANANYDPTQISFKELRLDELLLDARQELTGKQPGYKVSLIFDHDAEDDDLITVLGNEYLLKTAFINLIENGCKFSANQESVISISYDLHKSVLRFSDTGIGIPEADLPNIFQPFFRGSNETFADGNGIGLALTQKIITIHNGEISVFSITGEGTTFLIELPHLPVLGNLHF